MPGQLLMHLGYRSKKYLSSIAPINTSITLLIEKDNRYDIYGRTLAYVILPDGTCLNETLIIAGYQSHIINIIVEHYHAIKL
jgi:micrococcal nuclease